MGERGKIHHEQKWSYTKATQTSSLSDTPAETTKGLAPVRDAPAYLLGIQISF